MHFYVAFEKGYLFQLQLIGTCSPGTFHIALFEIFQVNCRYLDDDIVRPRDLANSICISVVIAVMSKFGNIERVNDEKLIIEKLVCIL